MKQQTVETTAAIASVAALCIFALVISPFRVGMSADAYTALFTAVSAIAIVATAVYAKNAYEQARYHEKVRLTVSMMESPWLLMAVEHFNALMLSARSLNAAQEIATTALKNNLQPLSSVFGSLTYVATLYAADYYEAEVLFSRGYVSVIQAYYVFEPTLRNRVESGWLEPSVFKLGQTFVRRARLNPILVAHDPGLRDYLPGADLYRS